MFIKNFLKNFTQAASICNIEKIECMVDAILTTRENGGRLFIIGVGGSAGNASHAVNDFRKIVDIESYTPTDNASELTARINDDGWESVFLEWLKVSRLNKRDSLLLLSVGGGNFKKNISVNLIRAASYAKSLDSKVLCIVGRNGGEICKIADVCLLIPIKDPSLVTPITEATQSMILHLLVSHPRLAKHKTKW